MSPRSTFAEYRLPPGRHGIPPEEVAANQRWRLLGAVTEEIAENGRLGTTSTSVSRRAGVSPATFYKHFANISECLLAAYEMSANCLWDATRAACREPDLPWDRRLGEALGSGLRFLAAEPAIAATLGAEVPADEPEVARARDRLIARLAGLLAEGCDEDVAPNLVAGALALVNERVRVGDFESLPRLAPELEAIFHRSS